jgi:hypothetical protein
MPPAASNPRARLALILASVFLLSLAATAWSFDTPAARSTLKGIKALRVQIAPLPTDLQRLGLAWDQIQADVELRLRQAGIIVSQAEATATPLLWVALNSLPRGDSFFVSFSIKLDLVQFVQLARDMSIGAPAPTWGVDTVGTGDMHPTETNRTAFRDFVRELVDRFINAYLEQNPKP